MKRQNTMPMHPKRGKRAQVTIFVIIALVIVVAAVLLWWLWPAITSSGSSNANPQQMFQTCLEDEFASSVQQLSLQGGSLNPEHYLVYNSENIAYLCYATEYYAPCVVQQPLLKQHIERELAEALADSAKTCFSQIKTSLEKDGAGVTLREGDAWVELLPERTVMNFNTSMTVTRDSSQTYSSFRVVLNNNLYEFASIAESIINFEARYGDAETTTYMNYYHDLQVEKKNQLDGTTVYILTNLNTLEQFQFASRSVAWPPGYT